MTTRLCSIEDCVRVTHAREMCQVHYDLSRQQLTGVCKIEGCSRVVRARKMCASHYTMDQRPKRDPRFTCKQCHQKFLASELGRSPMYCSPQCKERARSLRRNTAMRDVQDRECVVCGSRVDMSRSRNLKTECCSPKCSEIYQNRKRAEAQREAALKVRAEQVCEHCGGRIPESRRAGVKFCSWECKHRAVGLRYREHNPDFNMKHLYSITTKEYEALLTAQGGRCAICRTDTWTGKGPHIDHDHETGLVRGILCHKCNLGIGKLQDDTELMEAAVAYIKRQPLVWLSNKSPKVRSKAPLLSEPLVAQRDEMHLCRGCGKPISTLRKATTRYCDAQCRVAFHNSRKTTSAYMRFYNYGITPDEYEALLAFQDGRCAICQTQEWGSKGPHLDHCHNSNVIRGILCQNCNLGLGYFKDDPALLDAAAYYIRSHRQAHLTTVS